MNSFGVFLKVNDEKKLDPDLNPNPLVRGMDPQHCFLGDDEDRDKLERMTEREREEELFKRAERREELKKRSGPSHEHLGFIQCCGSASP